MVISGPQMQITPDTILLLANDQRELGVRLQTNDSIHDMDPGFLQRTSPLDVCRFIEPRLKFNHYGYLLAALGCFRQGSHDLRVAAGTIHSLLDSKYVRVFRRLLDEIQNALKAFVGMMYENGSTPNLGEDVFLICGSSNECGNKRFRFEIWPINSGNDWHQAEEIDRSIHRKQIGVRKAERLQKLI